MAYRSHKKYEKGENKYLIPLRLKKYLKGDIVWIKK